MPAARPTLRLALIACAVLAAGGCSLLHRGAKAPPKADAPAAAVAASAPAEAPAPVPMFAAVAPAPAASLPPAWDVLPLRHLDPVAMVGQTWIFPSPDPLRSGNNRFVFKADRVEASNAHDHATGTWTVERDRLCVTLRPGPEGTACYVVTGATPAELRIRTLPGSERLPLKIQ